MRPTAADHSLWIAIEHASKLDPGGFSKPSEGEVKTCVDLLLRALDAGANPDAEFTLPTQEGERVHLSCMERAFGQLHGVCLVPLLARAVELGWHADRLPSGLWATGQKTQESKGFPPRPERWRLASDLAGQEPGWLQLVAQGHPWGKDASARLCTLLIAAQAPFDRPARALLGSPDDHESFLAYGELRPPLHLALGRGGNLEVAMELIRMGALAQFTTPASVKSLMDEVRFSSREGDEQASTLISLLKSHSEALLLKQASSPAGDPEPSRPRRSL